MRIFNLAGFILFTAFCTIVAVSNRTIVAFTLDPLPLAYDLPVYWVLFMGIFIGLGAGALVVIGKSLKQAQLNRKQTKKIRALEKQLVDLTPPPAASAPQTNDNAGQTPPTVAG